MTMTHVKTKIIRVLSVNRGRKRVSLYHPLQACHAIHIPHVAPATTKSNSTRTKTKLSSTRIVKTRYPGKFKNANLIPEIAPGLKSLAQRQLVFSIGDGR